MAAAENKAVDAACCLDLGIRNDVRSLLASWFCVVIIYDVYAKEVLLIFRWWFYFGHRDLPGSTSRKTVTAVLLKARLFNKLFICDLLVNVDRTTQRIPRIPRSVHNREHSWFHPRLPPVRATFGHSMP